jgi:hypothetical protein
MKVLYKDPTLKLNTGYSILSVLKKMKCSVSIVAQNQVVALYIETCVSLRAAFAAFIEPYIPCMLVEEYMT